MIDGESGRQTDLCPRCLADYHGQDAVKQQLLIFIQAAKARRESLDHLLLIGPPGLGKTTLAHLVALELGVNVKSLCGPVVERPGDLAAILTNLAPFDLLFIDEIHRLSPQIEELLYPALEGRRLDLIIGEGPGARALKLDLPPFTLVGATTRAGLLTAPLRDRFGITARLSFYSLEALSVMIQVNATRLGLEITPEATFEIARRSRGTPRIANRLLKRTRDVAQVQGRLKLTLPIAQEALALLSIDSAGFDPMDRRLLETLITTFSGGPVGVENLAARLGESAQVVEEVVEPYLIQEGFLQRTPRGRIATLLTYKHFGLPYPEENR